MESDPAGATEEEWEEEWDAAWEEAEAWAVEWAAAAAEAVDTAAVAVGEPESLLPTFFVSTLPPRVKVLPYCQRNVKIF